MIALMDLFGPLRHDFIPLSMKLAPHMNYLVVNFELLEQKAKAPTLRNEYRSDIVSSAQSLCSSFLPVMGFKVMEIYSISAFYSFLKKCHKEPSTKLCVFTQEWEDEISEIPPFPFEI